ncbi:MAG: hypothetical protein HY901_29080 [Deltaproteobacteria bacterium]|nr:hypothetical protein [Deltaproteobacteria bacterium]
MLFTAKCHWRSLPLALLVGVAPGCPAETGRASISPAPTGSWGGEHIALNLTSAGGTLEYDCASGTIDEPVMVDRTGNFEVRGVHRFESGGPRRAGAPPPPDHPALYRGAVHGNEMTLTVTLFDSGEPLGSFSLGFGRPPNLEKCL